MRNQERKTEAMKKTGMRTIKDFEGTFETETCSNFRECSDVGDLFIEKGNIYKKSYAILDKSKPMRNDVRTNDTVVPQKEPSHSRFFFVDENTRNTWSLVMTN